MTLRVAALLVYCICWRPGGDFFYLCRHYNGRCFQPQFARVDSVDSRHGLVRGRIHLAASAVGQYVLFSGGVNGSQPPYSTVDVFDLSQMKLIQSFDLAVPREQHAMATLGPYICVAGGITDSTGYTFTSAVEVIDSRDWTLGLAENLTGSGWYGLSSASSKYTAFFAGGFNNIGGNTWNNAVDYVLCGNDVRRSFHRRSSAFSFSIWTRTKHATTRALCSANSVLVSMGRWLAATEPAAPALVQALDLNSHASGTHGWHSHLQPELVALSSC